MIINILYDLWAVVLKAEARYGWDEEDQYYEYDPEEASQWELEGWVQDQRGDWVQDQQLRQYRSRVRT